MKNEEETRLDHYKGRLSPRLILNLSLIGVFSALICILTMVISIPIPATQGFINIGDAGVMICGMLFGPIIGGFSGGIGSSLADIFLGFTLYAPGTLIIKGLEGFLAGLVTNRRSVFRDVLAVVAAGCEMVVGYFLVELYVLPWGLGGALSEVPGNIAQIIIGGVVGIPIALVLRRRLAEILK